MRLAALRPRWCSFLRDFWVDPKGQSATILQRLIVLRPVLCAVNRSDKFVHKRQFPRWIRNMNPRSQLFVQQGHLLIAMRTASRRNSSVFLFAIPYLLHSKHYSKETGTKPWQDQFIDSLSVGIVDGVAGCRTKFSSGTSPAPYQIWVSKKTRQNNRNDSLIAGNTARYSRQVIPIVGLPLEVISSHAEGVLGHVLHV